MNRCLRHALLVLVLSGCQALPLSLRSRDAAAPTSARSLPALIQAAEHSERLGMPDEAIRRYEEILAADPSAPTIAHRLAVLCDREGNSARAATAYEAAVAQAPNDPDVLNDCGVFHLHRDRLDEAEAWFRRALAAQPGHPRAANNLGTVLCLRGALAESFEMFAATVGPAAAYANMGVLLSRQQRVPEAQAHFRQALSLDGSLRTPREFLNRLDGPQPTASTERRDAATVRIAQH